MRILFILALLLAGNSANAAPADELVTGANAILCLEAGSLMEANQANIAQSQRKLRKLSCLRSGAGVPLVVLERTHTDIWKVSFRPQGISGGVTLWGRATSFTTPDGEPAVHSTRAER